MKISLSRISSILTLTAAMAVALPSCSDDKPRNPADETAERTVLIYMVAANSLGVGGSVNGTQYNPADEDDIAEMVSAAGSIGDDRRVLVLRSTYTGNPTLSELKTDGLHTLRQYSADKSVLTVDRMREIISDARRLAPARHMGLVLWSHADGWVGTQTATQTSTPKRRSFGIDRTVRMELPDLAEALRGHDLEYVYFDCCLMASVEVMYELRDAAPYIVASTTELPRPGMPYDITLPMLLDGAPGGITDAARATYGYYENYPSFSWRTCTISVTRTDALDELADATAAIYNGAPLPHQGRQVTNYRGTGRRGYWLDFGEYVTSLTADKTLLDNFNSAIGRAVIYKASTPMIWSEYPVYHDSGLSTYVFDYPSDMHVKGYDDLQWARDVVSIHIKSKE